MASNIHLHQHLMGSAPMAVGPTLKMEFPHLRFSTLTAALPPLGLTLVCHIASNGHTLFPQPVKPRWPCIYVCMVCRYLSVAYWESVVSDHTLY